jgi:hypothetical protein
LKPKFIEGLWYIEVATKEFGNILLFNPYTELATPIQFKTENEALEYIKISQTQN